MWETSLYVSGLFLHPIGLIRIHPDMIIILLRRKPLMKKIFALLLVLCMVVAAVGCGAKPAAQEAAAPAPAAPAAAEPAAAPAAEPAAAPAAKPTNEYKVVALLSGVITDNGWNQICYESAKAISEKYGTELEYIESIAVADMEEYIRDYGKNKYDMVIVHGSQFQTALEDVAADYPDTYFCLSYGFKIDSSTSVELKDLPNLAYVGPVDMGVVIGGIMGILTNNNKVVFLGGQDIPAITDIVSGIKPGVALTNPNCEVVTDYLGTLTDADLAKEKALSYIDNGFDVISASANSAQLGCLHAAEERGVYALGFNGDQYSIAPEAVVLSVMRNYPAIYVDVFESILNGTLPAEKVEAINAFIEKVFAGGYDGQY